MEIDLINMLILKLFPSIYLPDSLSSQTYFNFSRWCLGLVVYHNISLCFLCSSLIQFQMQVCHTFFLFFLFSVKPVFYCSILYLLLPIKQFHIQLKMSSNLCLLTFSPELSSNPPLATILIPPHARIQAAASTPTNSTAASGENT